MYIKSQATLETPIILNLGWANLTRKHTVGDKPLLAVR